MGQTRPGPLQLCRQGRTAGLEQLCHQMDLRPPGCDKFLTSQIICTSAALGCDTGCDTGFAWIWHWKRRGCDSGCDTGHAVHVAQGNSPCPTRQRWKCVQWEELNSLTSCFSLHFGYSTIKHFIFKSHSFSFLHLLFFKRCLPSSREFSPFPASLRGKRMSERS